MYNGPTFRVEYKYNGGTHGFVLKAEDFEDANAKLGAVRETGIVAGEIVRRIPIDDDEVPDVLHQLM